MSFRKTISIDFGNRMAVNNAALSMNGNTSKGLTKWANKDIKKAADSGDWSELLTKANKATIYFRNNFYR